MFYHFSGEDITDLQVQCGSNKERILEKNCTKDSEIWLKQLEDQFDEQGCYISFDPLHDGNSQFSSFCCILREFGFHLVTWRQIRMIPVALLWIFIWMFYAVTT